MDAGISTYKEFNNVDEAADAVRALHSAGFEDIETFDLTPNLHQIDDVGAPTSRKKWTYPLCGVVVGAAIGVTLGAILFYAPAQILGTEYTLALTVVGVGACTLFATLIGLQEGWILAKRACVEPTSSSGGRSVGVKVKSRDSSRVIMAKAILAQF